MIPSLVKSGLSCSSHCAPPGHIPEDEMVKASKDGAIRRKDRKAYARYLTKVREMELKGMIRT